jgi:Ni/Fe-hydrogenase 1 B-type cytochrome subunit
MISEANNNIEIVQEIEQELEFSSVYRWQHWIRAISIVVLTITGCYIAVPFLTPAVNADPTNFMQALIRSWHIIFGFVLISAVLFNR